MMHLQGIPGRTAIVDKQDYSFFSGFAYLGMPSLPEFQEVLQEGIRKYGAVFPSSRISNTRLSIFDTFEERLSEFTGWQATACFSSGYLAAMAAVRFAAQQGPVYSLKNIHPSLQVGKSHHRVETTAALLREIQQTEKPATIVLESVNPLAGKIIDFDWLLQLDKPTRVIVDDSHGIGILGNQGRGIKEFLPRAEHLRYLVCYSLSKAFSCEGGAVSGSRKEIGQLKARPPFTASTPMSPAFVFAWMNSRTLFEKQWRKLRENIQYFAREVSKRKEIDFDDRLPICRFPDPLLYERALKKQILLSAFRYPTEKDNPMTRAVLNALHTEEDIDRLLECIRQTTC